MNGIFSPLILLCVFVQSTLNFVRYDQAHIFKNENNFENQKAHKDQNKANNLNHNKQTHVQSHNEQSNHKGKRIQEFLYDEGLAKKMALLSAGAYAQQAEFDSTIGKMNSKIRDSEEKKEVANVMHCVNL